MTFKTPPRFPQVEWNDVIQILISELYGRVSRSVMPVIEDFLDTADLEVMNKVIDLSPFPAEFYREKLLAFM